MKRLVFVVSLSAIALGCDRSGSDAEGSSGPPPDRPPAERPTCELASTVALADENEVAPNGQTGARMLSAIPESAQTTLHWDFSAEATSGSAAIEVEIPGSSGLSTGIDLEFTLPAEPKFFFEDWEVVYPEGDVQLDIGIECLDLITTTLDVKMVTADGTISEDLKGLRVRLEADRPNDDYVAKPTLYDTVPMATPEVNFLKPEALPAGLVKTLGIKFDYDGISIDGNIVVTAEGSAGTYEHLVARW